MSVPEKETFPLDEVGSRWGLPSGDLSTFHDYARRDLILFAVYFKNLGSHKRVVKDSEVITTTTVTSLQFIAPGHNPESLKYLGSDDARRVLECGDGERAAISVLFASPTREKKSGMAYVPARFFAPGDLLITKEERDRFERQHDVRIRDRRVARIWQAFSEPRTLAAITGIASGLWVLFTWLAK